MAVPAPDGTGTVRVVVLLADGLAPPVAPPWLPLTADDRRRLAAFRRPDDARRFLTGRLLVHTHLRDDRQDRGAGLVLARRVDADGEHKPRLRWTDGRPGTDLPDVSITHSGRHVVAAFCHDGLVGVDVERHDAFHGPHDPVLPHVLTAAERALVRTSADAAAAFTAKEAVLKAVGQGLAVDPLRVEVLHGTVRRFDAVAARPTSVVPLTVADGCAGSLAVAAAPDRRRRP